MTTAESAVRKAILLAGGAGRRLHPLTTTGSKHLLPVYDKPMVYYPLATLMTLGFRRILLVATPAERPLYERLLGDGARLGIRIEYAEQPEPGGIAQAFLIAAPFLGGDPVALILGDNVFHGPEQALRPVTSVAGGARIFAYGVEDPGRYGVVELAEDGRPLSIEEKPSRPRSPLAVVGLYAYDGGVVDVARGLRPSARGELEITDVNRAYLESGRLEVVRLGADFAWLDTGTPQALLEASNFIATLEHRQGRKVGCIEEVAWRRGFIDTAAFRALAAAAPPSAYGDYLRRLSA